MSESTSSPITVKHRIGVDDQESYEELARFVEVVASRAPVKHFIVHARKALLNGISPEANRRIPPLKYDYVYRLVKVQREGGREGGARHQQSMAACASCPH